MAKAPQKTIIAFVGMPGAGKSEATTYLQKKGIPFVRFGQITDEGVKELGLPLTPDNERMFREKLRKELGMAAYAKKAKPKIEELLKHHSVIAIDGLYSWEEYTLLKNDFPGLFLIHVYAEPEKRYARLSHRPIRPVPLDKVRQRDITELEMLNKGGPIAIADYMLENNTDKIEDLYEKVDLLLARLGI
ncbi:MAG: AAA family ATPase [Candidatus Levybacteria bacterium]|nr:AAA family ATPase [Candidatus Levybacteria bacterium]